MDNDKMYIYIIIHPKFDSGWIKLGRAVNIQSRLQGYQTGCPLREYQLVYCKLLSKILVEVIENYFKLNIPNNGFEWYKCGIEEAIDYIDRLTIENSKLTDSIQTDIFIKRNPYYQKFIYSAYENIDEYSILEEKKFNTLKQLIDYFCLNSIDTKKLIKLFGKNKKEFKFKNLIISRKRFDFKISNQ